MIAMSETMSNPTEWMQFYSQNYSGQAVPPSSSTADDQPTLFPDRVSDATAVSAAVTGSSSPTALNRLSPEGGRVTKPIRRRSRASRRTPTTLLNTDTTNFRAMVQQFTGGPSAPFAASGSHPGAPVGFAFGLGAARQGFANPSAVMMPAVPAGYHHNLHLHHQQNLYQHPHQQQSQQYMLSGSATGAGAGHDNFFQRLSPGSRPVSSMGIGTNNTTEGFLLGSHAVAPAAATAAARPNSSNSANENRMGNSFMF